VHPDSSAWRRAHDRLNGVLERFYDLTLGTANRAYVASLAFFVRRRLDLVILLAAVFVGSYFAAKENLEFVRQQEEDQTQFEFGVEASNEYGFEDLADYFREVEKVLAARKEEFGLKGYFVFFRQRFGSIEGWFDDQRKSTLSAKEIAKALLEQFPKKPGIRIFQGEENRAEESKSRSVFAVHLEGDDAPELEEVATRIEPLFLAAPGVLGVRKGEESAPSEMALRIDRDRAAASGVNPEVIAGLVGYALRGSQLPKYNEAGNEIPVRIRFQEADRETMAELGGFQVPTSDGGRLTLDALTDSRVQNSPRSIFRRDKKTTRTLTFELLEKDAKVTRERLQALQRGLALPEGVTFGTSLYQDAREEMMSMVFAAGLSVIFIYLLMAFLFESLILPLSVILTIPLAGIGVVWMHVATGKDVDFLGAVGVILLIGVVVNNGIVLVDYVNRLREDGHERGEALLLAADRRFRPILMTALTTIIGMVPLTLSAPTEIGLSYKSFGLTLIGGMTTATFLTLLVVPVFYTFFDDLRVFAGATFARFRSRAGRAVG
jgi:HAE1 family hydrophobic/amphiphilic exporter-1